MLGYKSATISLQISSLCGTDCSELIVSLVIPYGFTAPPLKQLQRKCNFFYS